MPSLILGTAGHIDHGKTALVHALTGIDTDRLREEKERGITIDLGFAELSDGVRHMGVVDVPGHEGFIRNMVAGATGMDVVLLVIAADEGVMPQTREHLDIVTLLGVERLVVALTKADLVDEEWLEMVREEVQGLLAGGPYEGATILPTSVRTGAGVEALARTLLATAEQGSERDSTDPARLPVDRVFTVHGTGTVVTGTLRSGRLRIGDRVRVIPGELVARVRGLQVHGREVEEARLGERTAVALAGAGTDRQTLARGQAVISGPGWAPASMLTARLRVLQGAGWRIARGQRVRVHLGTAEVMARCAVLEAEALEPGDEGWVQLRLEEPVPARARRLRRTLLLAGDHHRGWAGRGAPPPAARLARRGGRPAARPPARGGAGHRGRSGARAGRARRGGARGAPRAHGAHPRGGGLRARRAPRGWGCGSVRLRRPPARGRLRRERARRAPRRRRGAAPE